MDCTALDASLHRLPSQAARAVQVAEQRADRLQRASRALQDTIDELGRVEHPERFVPRALAIAADVFGADTCGYFELVGLGRLKLRHAYRHGAVLSGPEWPGASPAQRMFLRQLFTDFSVGAEHLGADVVRRTAAIVLDHRSGRTWPAGHAFALSMGWELELNVPLLRNGAPAGAFAIYRRGSRPFDDEEIALAESLGCQLSLAMQMARVAERERELGAVRERERAAMERAHAMERINRALRVSVERLATLGDPRAVIVESLRAASEVLSPLQVLGMSWVQVDPAGGTARVRLKLRQDTVQDLSGTPLARDWPLSHPSLAGPWKRLCADGCVWGLVSDPEVVAPEVRAYHESVGTRSMVFVTLTRAGDCRGWIALELSVAVRPSPAQLDLIRALAGQVALAVEMGRLSDDARLATLSEERNRVAGEIHDSLAQNFAGVALQLETAEHALEAGEYDVVARSVDRARSLARFGLAEARRSVMTLRPTATLSQGLVPALHALCARSKIEGLLDCTFAVHGQPLMFDGETEQALFRIAQEALSNAVRHAGARRIDVVARYAAEGIELTIEDDGRGLPAGCETRAGHGLPAMRDRAMGVGGAFRAGPGPAGGTRITASVPRR